MESITRIIFIGILIGGLFFTEDSTAQKKGGIEVSWYYPKDSVRYEQDFPGQDYHVDRTEFGKTTMLIHVKSSVGTFDYILKKKILRTEKFEGGYVDVYGTKPDGTNGVVRKDYMEPYSLTEHNLYAFVYLYDHGGFLEKARFQDFGNVVYWPEFDYPNCFAADEDKDGVPEFYLTYSGFSDGLDPTEVKQIVYTIPEVSKGKPLTKSKAVRYLIKDGETDPEDYRDSFDAQWKKLPKSVQSRSLKILNGKKTK